ncbi:uncharacterized protein CDAR_310971 [Caerostris darwini]|uniref:Uncharacterized protein n=1 Tax=Caerostris darwini TaxID=1538125 RepID=A0AAV4WT62_9ARAC|nr:uncharacterized protein CDAR_310971 [Caerostris darwini]
MLLANRVEDITQKNSLTAALQKFVVLYFYFSFIRTVNDDFDNAVFSSNPLCWPCRAQEAMRTDAFKNCGKGPSDCRFKKHPWSYDRYCSLIPRYGPANDFDPSVHSWNCAGHTHCRHGQSGTIEERGLTFLRDCTNGYIVQPETRCGTVWSLNGWN